jgi:predicted RNase H-like nuclease (RuvC/YqgF family)
MPDINSDKTMAAAYPPQALYDSWSQHADALSISTSQFIIRMVEAGRKQIDVEELANESAQELRQQRSDLQQELDRQRNRVEKLEQQLHYTAQSDIIDYVEANPGATAPEIIQHIAHTVPERVASHLDLLEGDALEHHTDGYRLCADDADATLVNPVLTEDSAAETES